jgi:hypothetical protein
MYLEVKLRKNPEGSGYSKSRGWNDAGGRTVQSREMDRLPRFVQTAKDRWDKDEGFSDSNQIHFPSPHSSQNKA